MKIVATPYFKKSFSLLPKETKIKFRKQVNFLIQNDLYILLDIRDHPK